MSLERKRTILVVDDEFSIVETLVEILSWEGYEVRTASNGREGLEAIAQQKPDLVLVDFMMPRMDGVQMIRVLRAEKALDGMPVILMTAAPLRMQQVEPQWDRLLPKPFEVNALLGAIKGLLA